MINKEHETIALDARVYVDSNEPTYDGITNTERDLCGCPTCKIEAATSRLVESLQAIGGISLVWMTSEEMLTVVHRPVNTSEAQKNMLDALTRCINVCMKGMSHLGPSFMSLIAAIEATVNDMDGKDHE